LKDSTGVAGVMAREAREARESVTEDTDEPEIDPEVPVMVVVPSATAVKRPVLLIVPTAGFDDVQITFTCDDVPSVNLPVATSCAVPPGGRLVVEMLIESRFALKVSFVVPVTVMALSVGLALFAGAEEAVMVVVPAPTVVTTPVALMVATFVLEEVQVT